MHLRLDPTVPPQSFVYGVTECIAGHGCDTLDLNPFKM